MIASASSVESYDPEAASGSAAATTSSSSTSGPLGGRGNRRGGRPASTTTNPSHHGQPTNGHDGGSASFLDVTTLEAGARPAAAAAHGAVGRGGSLNGNPLAQVSRRQERVDSSRGSDASTASSRTYPAVAVGTAHADRPPASSLETFLTQQIDDQEGVNAASFRQLNRPTYRPRCICERELHWCYNRLCICCCNALCMVLCDDYGRCNRQPCCCCCCGGAGGGSRSKRSRPCCGFLACGDEGSVFLCTRPSLMRGSIGITIAAALVAYSATDFWSASLLKCVKLQNDLPPVMQAEPSVDCEGPERPGFQFMAYFGLLGIGLLIPIVLSFLLTLWRNELENEFLKGTLGFLYAGFDHHADSVERSGRPDTRDDLDDRYHDPDTEDNAGVCCLCVRWCECWAWHLLCFTGRTQEGSRPGCSFSGGACQCRTLLDSEFPCIGCMIPCGHERCRRQCSRRTRSSLFLWRTVMVMMRHTVITLLLGLEDANAQTAAVFTTIVVSALLQWKCSPYMAPELNAWALLLLTLEAAIVLAAGPAKAVDVQTAGVTLLGVFFNLPAPDLGTMPTTQLFTGVAVLIAVTWLFLTAVNEAACPNAEEAREARRYARNHRISEYFAQRDAAEAQAEEASNEAARIQREPAPRG